MSHNQPDLSDGGILRGILSHFQGGREGLLTMEFVHFIALLSDFWRIFLNTIPEAEHRNSTGQFSFSSSHISQSYAPFHQMWIKRAHEQNNKSENEDEFDIGGGASESGLDDDGEKTFEKNFAMDGFASEDVLHVERDSFLSPLDDTFYTRLPFCSRTKEFDQQSNAEIRFLLNSNPYSTSAKCERAHLHMARRRLLEHAYYGRCDGDVKLFLDRIDSNLEGMLVPPGLRLTSQFLFEHLLFLTIPANLFTVCLPYLTHAIEDICRELANPNRIHDSYYVSGMLCNWTADSSDTLIGGPWLRFHKGDAKLPFDVGFENQQLSSKQKKWAIGRSIANLNMVFKRCIYTETYHRSLYQFRLRNWCHKFKICDQDGAYKQLPDATPMSQVIIIK